MSGIKFTNQIDLFPKSHFFPSIFFDVPLLGQKKINIKEKLNENIFH